MSTQTAFEVGESVFYGDKHSSGYGTKLLIKRMDWCPNCANFHYGVIDFFTGENADWASPKFFVRTLEDLYDNQEEKELPEGSE